jgi:hypothetical protein
MDPTQENAERKMRISIAHPHHFTREVLAKVLSNKLGAEVLAFSCLEDLLDSSMDFDVFVVYSSFDPHKMDRMDGIRWIRHLRPEALVISMIHRAFFERKQAPPGADLITFCAGDDIPSVVKLIQKHQQKKSLKSTTG